MQGSGVHPDVKFMHAHCAIGVSKFSMQGSCLPRCKVHVPRTHCLMEVSKFRMLGSCAPRFKVHAHCSVGASKFKMQASYSPRFKVHVPLIVRWVTVSSRCRVVFRPGSKFMPFSLFNGCQ